MDNNIDEDVVRELVKCVGGRIIYLVVLIKIEHWQLKFACEKAKNSIIFAIVLSGQMLIISKHWPASGIKCIGIF